ncbi:LysR substrate-binding domain-containing protein [Peptoniphilus sp.]|jgi:DNA-binding transcriptional LysR family regulator|uniref:LysR substrate-binding domain-containing protein n=1 Tax=Peptoniphilus sp. TaxID=1971214 RepID=UPI003D9325B9
MTIRDLEIFIEVVRTKNMSVAAKNLNISQPTVSQAISQIEKEYNVTLFDRISKKLYITDVGARLYKSALILLEEFENTMIFLHGASKSNNIHLGISSNFGCKLMLELVKEFEEKYEDVNIRVFIDTRQNLIEKLKSKEISLAIIEDETGISGITSEPFFTDELVLITNKDYNFGVKKSLTLDDLKEREFIMGEFDDNAKKILLDYLKDKNISVNLKYIAKNNCMFYNIIKNSNTVSLGSKYFIDDPEIKKHRFDDVKLERQYYLTYQNEDIIKEDVNNFVEFIKEKFKNGKS